MNAKAALLAIAVKYFGPSLLGYKYAVYTYDALATVFTIDKDTAFFSVVWPRGKGQLH